MEKFNDWAQNYVDLEVSEWCATDGKSIKGTVKNYDSSSQNFANIVSISERSHLTYFVEMVILPSQLPRDLSLMILTNFFTLWNETALPLSPLSLLSPASFQFPMPNALFNLLAK
ncbi:hypothetical protein [Nostoc sp.]|uniref:hypothetical protein n=1 Tax=Nostoc sp. TaxID=1180 RepID=UPI002FF99057